MVNTIEFSAIVLGKRQRQHMDAKELSELARSIETTGLLQPPGVWKDNSGKLHLVFGGRRLAAISALAKDKKPIICADGTAVPLGHTPYVELALADLALRKDAELAENIYREELSWQDRARALAEIHALKQELNPDQTARDTARELEASGPIDVGVKHLAKQVTISVAIAKNLSDPDVAKAKTATDAFQIIQRKEANRASAILIKRRAAITADVNPIQLLCGDANALLKLQPANEFDLIFTDPPYGINADDPNFSRRHANTHVYTDDPKLVREMLQDFVLSVFRVAKPRSNLFMFTDTDHFVFLRDAAARAGWSVWRTPIIWDKLSPGLGVWQTEGFQRQFEIALFATKGQRGLSAPIPDILSFPRVPSKDKIHAAQKPVALIERLLSVLVLPGDRLLDPFAGSGATLVAARNRKVRALGFELNRATYDDALVNLFANNN